MTQKSTTEPHKDILDFMTALFNPASLPLELSSDPEKADKILNILFDDIICAVLNFPRKLNAADTSSQVAIDDHVANHDPIFASYVEFTKKFLLTNRRSRKVLWISRLSTTWIEFSSKMPLVSGFYQLFGVCLRICVDFDYFSDSELDHDRLAQLSLFKAYVSDVLVRMQTFKDELLASCLSLVLSSPVQIVDIDGLLVEIRSALTLGLSYAPLAITAVETLERWTKALDQSRMETIYAAVLPSLANYLAIDPSSTELASITSSGDPSNTKMIDTAIAAMRERRFRNLRLSPANDQ
eukprot:jgi/Hompol1/1843/HPOL_005745-RA